LAERTRATAVADRIDVNREDFDFIVDQLLGADGKTRRYKVDVADIATFLQQIDAP
jgi:hypothetical protein